MAVSTKNGAKHDNANYFKNDFLSGWGVEKTEPHIKRIIPFEIKSDENFRKT